MWGWLQRKTGLGNDAVGLIFVLAINTPIGFLFSCLALLVSS